MAVSFVLKLYPSEARIVRDTICVASLADFTFEALCQCARKLLPNEQVLRYQWKDPDSELISLETDDHLLEALRNMQCTNDGKDCLRIYPTVVANSHEPVVNDCAVASQSGPCNVQSLATAEDFPDRKPKLETLSEAIVVVSQPETTASSEYVLAVVCKEEDCVGMAHEAVDTIPSADICSSSDVETGGCKDLASLESTTLIARIKLEPKMEPADESLQESVVNAEETEMEQEGSLDTAYLRTAIDSSQNGQPEDRAVANEDRQIEFAEEHASDERMLEAAVNQVGNRPSNDENSSPVCESAQPEVPEAQRSPQVFAVKAEPVNGATSTSQPIQVAAGGNLLVGSPRASIPNSLGTNHEETLGNSQKQLPLVSRFGRHRIVVKPKPKVASNLTSAAGPSLAHNASADVPVEFDCGDIVWAHLGRYPWWPSIVAPDPSTRGFTQIKGRSRAYHVFFLGDSTRSWVSRSSLIPFDGIRKFDDYINQQVQSVSSPVMRRKIKQRFELRPSFESQWHNSISLAEEAAQLQKTERLDTYCTLSILKSALHSQKQVELLKWECKDISPDKDKSITRSVLSEGDTWEKPNDAAIVDAHIVGRHADRVFVDSDFKFPIGECTEQGLPEGVDIALKQFRKGESSIITLQPKWGYGKAGKADFGIPPQAALEFDIHLMDFEKAKESWEMNVDEKLSQADALKAQGTEFFQKGKYKLAVAKYKRIVDFLQFETTWQNEKKATRDQLYIAAHLNLALCCLKSGDTVKCVKHCDMVLADEKNNVKALYHRGQAYQQQNDFELARKDFVHVLELAAGSKAAALGVQQCKHAIEAQNKRDKIYSYMFKPLQSSKAVFKQNGIAPSAEVATEKEKRNDEAVTTRKRTSDTSLLQPKPKTPKTETKRQSPRLSMPPASQKVKLLYHEIVASHLAACLMSFGNQPHISFSRHVRDLSNIKDGLDGYRTLEEFRKDVMSIIAYGKQLFKDSSRKVNTLSELQSFVDSLFASVDDS